MTFTHQGEEHTVDVASDDEFVTIVNIDGMQFECDHKMIIDHRDPDGELSDRGLRSIAISIFKDLDRLDE